MSNYLFLIKKLVLTGHRKNYVIPFHPGVNIIYGDGDTGKSSILRIINYMLGGKEIQLDHEISSSVIHATLDLEINGGSFCIRRDLYAPQKNIEVFSCNFEEIESNFPSKLSPNLNAKVGGPKSISEFLLGELNFPIVKLKQSPTKDTSGVARLSSRDLMKYSYLNQDAVGSRKMLDIGHPVVEVKNREVFKYIFNILDSNITDVTAEIAAKAKEKAKLESRISIISDFLEETEFSNSEDINVEIKQNFERRKRISSYLEQVKKRVVSQSKSYSIYKSALESAKLSIDLEETRRINSIRSIERFDRLRNEFINDIEKLKAIETSSHRISIDNGKQLACPICDSKIEIQKISDNFSISSEDKVRQEINSLTRRVRELKEASESHREAVREVIQNISMLNIEREKAVKLLDAETSEAISPYLSERDTFVAEVTSLEEKHGQLLHEMKILNQHDKLTLQLTKLTTNIGLLKGKLEKLEKSAPSISEILTDLSSDLNSYLKKINIKTRVGISIDEKSFLPVVRNVEYRHINSGGLRTILSIGYLAILLKNNLIRGSNSFNFIMVDTVGKYIGKTAEQDILEAGDHDDSGEFEDDPSKYRNIYEYLIDLAELFENEGKNCQILLVDNDVPQETSEKYKGFIVAHYSAKGVNGLPTGLIDDWDDFINKAN